MPTNLALDDRLINEARKLGRHSSKKAAVNAALEEYVSHHRQIQITELFGNVDFAPGYDYKKQRRQRT
jgi:Arc/MetJ family transcription regulator